MFISTFLFAVFAIYASANKRGIGAPWDSVGADLNKIPAGKISWIQNWETYRPPGGNQFEYVATLRTAHPDDLQRFKTNMPNNGARTLLCLNEPNEPSQANLSPQDAANIWRQYCWPQKQQRGIRLGSPSISNGQNGIPWLQRFMELTRDVPPDFVSAHWYGVDGVNMIRFVQSLRDIFQKPVWIPEFAHTNNNINDQRGLQAQVRQWMDNQWWLDRYAWFGCSREEHNNINEASRLLDWNGKLTDLCYKYAFDA